MDLGLRLRTLQSFHGSQLAARARIALLGRRRVAAPEGELAVAGAMPELPERHAVDVSGLAAGRFRHLNLERELGAGPVDWLLGDVREQRLWVVTLHYHEWAPALAARDPALLERLLRDWIARCAPEGRDALALAWNAYAVATRIPNWIRAWQRGGIADGFRREFLASLWRQAAFLAANLEWDLRANHLLRDALGLAFAGRFFAHERWLALARDLAISQAAEQLRPDGLHFELSPMYHAHALGDFEELAALLPGTAAIAGAVARMREAAAWLVHPDGGIALLNDASLAPRARHAAAEPARSDADRCFVFRDQLVCYRGDPWCVFFDQGEIGARCQPGHAHADSLTVEASYRGARLIVDPGCYAYDLDERRRYDRSTAAHNTVCIDGRDSSEVWHIFRVGRRARPIAPTAHYQSGELVAAGSHDGYDGLPGRPRHRRELALRGPRFAIADEVAGAGRHRVEGGFTLAPGVRGRAAAGGFALDTPSGSLMVVLRGSRELALAVEPRAYHPEFGVEALTQRLVWRCEGELPLRVDAILEPA
jgi:uncharacterized heparinase superfamily protein